MCKHPFFDIFKVNYMKKSKKIFFITLLIVLVVIFFGVILAQAIFFVPADETTLPSPAAPSPAMIQEPLPMTSPNLINSGLANKNIAPQIYSAPYPTSYPTQLRIPSIKVNAKIQYIGIAKNGKMATPNNFTDVGWFQNGIVPGSKGSAVIDGHVDNGLAFPAVFASLDNLNVGDDIYIDTVGGSILHFKVIKTQNYAASAETTEIFNQNDGNYLKLITCAGIWSILHRTHDQRLVVTAEQV